jgi:catechol 2,3-dioxygenase-like lactoylglutathione lyase family enzyme
MIRHVASIAEIVEDVDTAVHFYRDALGLEVEYEPGSGYGLVQVDGTLHFGLWSRTEAANATFGDPSAADRIPLGFTVGFEVDDVEDGRRGVEAKGWSVAQAPKEEGALGPDDQPLLQRKRCPVRDRRDPRRPANLATDARRGRAVAGGSEPGT